MVIPDDSGSYRIIWGHSGFFWDHLGLFRFFFGIIWGYLWSFGVIQGHLESFPVIRGHSGSFGVIWESFEIIWGLLGVMVIRRHTGSFGTIRDHSGSFGPWVLWSFGVIRGHSGIIQGHLGSYEVIWVYLGPFRAILGHLELFGLGNSFILTCLIFSKEYDFLKSS